MEVDGHRDMGALSASSRQCSFVEGAGDDIHQRIGATPFGTAATTLDCCTLTPMAAATDTFEPFEEADR